MAIEVTERWPDTNWDREGNTALIAFDVIGTDPDDHGYQALAAVPYQKNSGHPQSSAMKCRAPRVRNRPGVSHWIIDCPFAIPDSGGTFPDDDDPLSQPAVISWPDGLTQIEVDRNKDGFPIVNSALEGFAQPSVVDHPQQFLVVKKNLPFFNAAQAIDYRNSVNQNAWSLQGIPFPPRHIKLNSIRPEGEYELANVDYVTVVYTFELSDKPFIIRRLDEGETYTVIDAAVAGGIRNVPFSQDNGGAAVRRLNGQGGEYGTNDGVASPAGVDSIEDTGDAVFLNYAYYKERDFGALGL